MITNHHHVCPSPHLSTAELRALLHQDADDGPGQAASHLDACTVCQSRLTALAADAHVWSDAQSYLGGAGEPRWQPDASHSGLLQSASDAESAHSPDSAAHDLVMQLLGTPSHPEMLGRLGRFDIERVIGSGGMGVVLKAHDTELNRPIAIKLLAPHLAHVGPARERFAREGRAAAAVVHEHVVAIYNVESSGPLPFLVMQYVPGRSLEARVTDDGPLEVEEILRIGIQAAAGLAAAHRQGLVHRDVKPANILLENSVERAILTDFGLARAIDDATLTQTGILAGTPHYMSPEQAGGGPIDGRSDLFSLGAVLYFMATGHPPFRGTNALGVLHRICHDVHRPVWQLNPAIPDELSDVIDRLLEKKPGRRFATAEEVQQKLSSLLSRAQQQGLGRRRFRWWPRRRRRWEWAAGTAVLLAALIGGVSWFAGPADVQPDLGTAHTPSSSTPSLDGASSQSSADASRLHTSESEYYHDLDAALGELGAASTEARYLRFGDDAWQRELESLRRELSQIESATGPFSD